MAAAGAALALAGAGLTATAIIATTATSAQATTPGTPGTLQAPTSVYTEDFENGPAASPILHLDQYTSATGQSYTADPGWLTGCNGWLAAAEQDTDPAAQEADCATQPTNGRLFWNETQQLAEAFGIFHGESAAEAADNHAVSALTSSVPPAGSVEFGTATNIALPTSSRFLAFSVDVAADCLVSPPLLQFSLVSPGGAQTPVGSQLNGCAGSTPVSVPAIAAAGAREFNVGTHTTDAAVLFSGASVGIRMVNDNASPTGNDHAFDNIHVLDVTPQLDQSFSPTRLGTGQSTTLTFTITNTSELGAKNGWSFTDALPDGVTVSGAATTTCPEGAVTAAPDASTVSATGDLSTGMSSCSVSFPVTASVASTYTSGPSNLTSLGGLNPPADTSVQFLPTVDLHVRKTASNDHYAPEQLFTYTLVVTNNGPDTASGVTVADPLPAALAGGSFTWTCSGSGGSTCTPSGGGDIDDSAVVAANTSVVYTVTGTVPGATTGELSNTATVTPPADSVDTGCTPDCASTVTTPEQAAALTLDKSVTPNDPIQPTAGQQVNYSFQVTNSGNVPLTGLTIDDAPFTGTGELSAITCPVTTLVASAQTTCTASYPLTQLDLDRGGIDNSATASATPPLGPLVSSAPASAHVSFAPGPALTLTEMPNPSTIHRAGDVVSYSFTVTNTGDVTLTDSAIIVGAFSGTGALSPTCPAAAASMPPGAVVTCTASYTATQADIDAGTITNTVTAHASFGQQAVTSDPATAAVAAPPDPALRLIKRATVDPAADQNSARIGDSISYTFLVTNSGNLTLTAIEVTDPSLGRVACPITTLPPGGDETCTGDETHTVTEADVAAGSVQNTATARAATLRGGLAVSSADASTTVDTAPPAPTAPTAPATPPLAMTGVDILLPSGLGLGALVLGMVLVVGARRRGTR
jgi:uncharacterized repeat protein (TIGR01451 family)